MAESRRLPGKSAALVAYYHRVTAPGKVYAGNRSGRLRRHRAVDRIPLVLKPPKQFLRRSRPLRPKPEGRAHGGPQGLGGQGVAAVPQKEHPKTPQRLGGAQYGPQVPGVLEVLQHQARLVRSRLPVISRLPGPGAQAEYSLGALGVREKPGHRVLYHIDRLRRAQYPLQVSPVFFPSPWGKETRLYLHAGSRSVPAEPCPLAQELPPLPPLPGGAQQGRGGPYQGIAAAGATLHSAPLPYTEYKRPRQGASGAGAAVCGGQFTVPPWPSPPER